MSIPTMTCACGCPTMGGMVSCATCNGGIPNKNQKQSTTSCDPCAICGEIVIFGAQPRVCCSAKYHDACIPDREHCPKCLRVYVVQKAPVGSWREYEQFMNTRFGEHKWPQWCPSNFVFKSEYDLYLQKISH
jgi:hypothetical protein